MTEVPEGGIRSFLSSLRMTPQLLGNQEHHRLAVDGQGGVLWWPIARAFGGDAPTWMCNERRIDEALRRAADDE
jgi:hypothetical protein